MKEKIKDGYFSFKKKIIEKYLDLYLYYIKGVEDGPRIEKRMMKFQNKIQRMMKRRGIALVAYKIKDNDISISFVPEQTWDAQKDREMEKVMDKMMQENGDDIGIGEIKDAEIVQ